MLRILIFWLFYTGDNFCDCFFFERSTLKGKNSLPNEKGSPLKGKKLLIQRGSRFFHFRVDPLQKGDIKNLKELSCLKVYLFF